MDAEHQCLTDYTSVRLLSAFGRVLFFRPACELRAGESAGAASVAFTLGTTFSPSAHLRSQPHRKRLVRGEFYWLRGGSRPVLAGLRGSSLCHNYGWRAVSCWVFRSSRRRDHWAARSSYAIGGSPLLILSIHR